VAPDEVAADRGETRERPDARAVDRLRPPGEEVGQELGPGVLAGAEKDAVGVRGRLLRERGHVEATESDVGAFPPVMVG
jgi:hypothetical protein